jgi:CubicO group peptidase (beta-lactamase class C family)
VGKLGIDGGKEELVLKYVRELAKKSEDPKSGKTDSLLIAYKNKLLFESYFRRGRRNYPHYQMSITKSYTAYAIGRAIQLGHLSMDDLHKPVVSFLKEIKPDKLARAADKITLDQAMQMRSGIRLPKKKIGEIIKRPSLLRGQGQARAYLQFSQDLPDLPNSSLNLLSTSHQIRSSRCRYWKPWCQEPQRILFASNFSSQWVLGTMAGRRI